MTTFICKNCKCEVQKNYLTAAKTEYGKLGLCYFFRCPECGQDYYEPAKKPEPL